MSKKKKHEKTLAEAIDELYESIDPDSPAQSSSTTPVENIVIKLKATIDELAKNFANAKGLILELARVLDETKQCELRSQICRKIKEMLKDKIAEGKITGKWIEECLPQEYKRRYNSNNIKSELSSLSDSEEEGDDNGIDAKTAEKILIDTSGRSSTIKEDSSSVADSYGDSSNNNNYIKDNKSKFTPAKSNQNNDIQNASYNQETSHFEAECLQCKELEDSGDAVLRSSSVVVCADKIQQNCANKIYHIHKEKYDLLRQAMNSSTQFCSLIFDKDGALVQVESDISKEENRC
jgi:hypothetical protein